MPEALKNLIHAGTVSQAGRHLQRVWPGFDRQGFEAHALCGLAGLEFKARAMQLADALQATLPVDFDQAAAVLEASLAPPLPLDERGEPMALGPAQADAGLGGWVVWSMGEVVARCGQHDLPRALRCLHALTQRFTAEFAIRPFIARQPQAVLSTLAQWVDDPSAHVRRLVSEGSRPRLPWGQRLHALVADPAPTLPLLRALQDDPSAYVRRSVANHLNDIAKSHPDLVARWVAEYRPGASAQRCALLRHASRGLVKQGHGPTLAAWGLASGLKGSAGMRLVAPTAEIGGHVGFEIELVSGAHRAQDLVIDYVVHHRRANGGTSPKVFKGWKLTLEAGQTRTLSRRHAMRPLSTRRLYPGLHRIDVVVNGRVMAKAAFDLLAPA